MQDLNECREEDKVTEERIQRLTVAEVRSEIASAGYDWKAGRTSVSALSPENQDARLGLAVPEGEMDRVAVAIAAEIAIYAFAPERDWRDKDGKDWMTSVKDQGGCGSCVAFATVATLEAQAQIQSNDPTSDINLSEADLFFCGAGRNCSKGWWPTEALEYAKTDGVSDEGCFPYQDHDMNCQLCSDRADRLLQIGNWVEVINIDQRKEWLDQKGPMIACMAVYRDFFSYKEGVYRHVTGDLAGYHAVCCVGYSEAEGCWICKNSWDEGWGDKGYFKIAYGEADMDTRFAMYGAEELYGPLMPDGKEEEGCGWSQYVAVDSTFDPERRVLWALVDGSWRYRVLTPAQLVELGSILMAAMPIQVCYKQDAITRIVGFRKLE